MQQGKNDASQRLYLENLLRNFEKKRMELGDQISRQQELLNRKSSKAWTEKKREKNERKLRETNKEFSQTLDLINQIQLKLETTGE